MAQAGYTVRTHVFEGPLDVLLDLIEKRKLFISDVSLSKVADDYIEYVKSLGRFPTADAAQFLLIASTLVLIKSKALLPSLDLSEEEEGNIKELEHRLALYQLFKDVGAHIKEAYGARPMFFRPQSGITEAVFAPHRRLTQENLHAALENTLARVPQQEEAPQVVVEQVTNIEDKIADLMERVQKNMHTSFNAFTQGRGKGGEGKEAKLEVIVGFIAMLELVKEGAIAVSQRDQFEDIEISSTGASKSK